jgi:hypothetical protein
LVTSMMNCRKKVNYRSFDGPSCHELDCFKLAWRTARRGGLAIRRTMHLVSTIWLRRMI